MERHGAVLRPIGIDNRHYCAKGEELEAAFGGEMPHTGLGALRDAITGVHARGCEPHARSEPGRRGMGSRAGVADP
jgi:hypothetical protein